MSKQCIHFLISGKVQGVWFRASTQSEARKLNLTGWVKNTEDGKVEIVACGEESQITQLHTWLKRGPPQAQVEEVLREKWHAEQHAHFEVR
ncbi:MAG: acylphosphatase [Gammaproteobacteria bacterium]|nr:acylphosphatase [Gammaproteobacteria bacterium]